MATTPSARSSRPTGPAPTTNPVLRLHQDLIGLRRRHPWLHRARTTQVELTNTTFVYEVRDGDDALLVALNLGDEPLASRPGGASRRRRRAATRPPSRRTAGPCSRSR